ncbi:OLC1v1010413C1 [Oldenlandia corymbosa var. corymbosa]|uniref:OLC1v1010413C1 n=1 Tax=Oldenlandia corymbosa var. corymbosa TaxID=529605 RepID=A0AAV1DSZ4_OLDCO|nr:OLC1v1010413C1 [Oldenlandia corymbosa var. corymbosa]
MQLIKVMDKQEMHDELVPPSPVLPRLDRLDRLLQLLEEKHNLSRRNPDEQKEIKPENDHCKTLSSALEEVQHKGTLMERLTMLENRVLQLSLEMDEENTPKSSSSTVPNTEKLDQNLKSPSGSGRRDEMKIHDQKNEVMTMPGRDSPVEVLDQDSNISSAAQEIVDKNGRRRSKKGYKKWIGWFHLGCN